MVPRRAIGVIQHPAGLTQHSMVPFLSQDQLTSWNFPTRVLAHCNHQQCSDRGKARENCQAFLGLCYLGKAAVTDQGNQLRTMLCVSAVCPREIFGSDFPKRTHLTGKVVVTQTACGGEGEAPVSTQPVWRGLGLQAQSHQLWPGHSFGQGNSEIKN